MEQRERVVSERVRFSRPVPEELAGEGFSAVDMHCHTDHSDAPVRVRDALNRARHLGIGLAITDHNAVSGSREAVSTTKDVLIIPGIEVSALDGPHILIYWYSFADLLDFYRLHIEKKKQKSPYLAIRLTTSEILDRLEGYSCLCTAAHPFGYLLFNKGVGRCVDREYLPPDIIPRFDAVEAICGGMPRSGNLRAIHLAEHYRLGIVGGTDAHLVSDYGSVLTCARADSGGEFLDRIRQHENIIIGTERNIIRKGLMGTMMITRYLPYTLPSLSIHYEQNLPRLQRFLRRLGGHRR
jgi:predicted metal-dependent phosphoesterase TrpH